MREPEAQPVAESEVLADDGSLWDPLPMTLPTYVNKARARRTVRTIELTGMHSSGHDQDDSALAREAEAAPPSRPPLKASRAGSPAPDPSDPIRAHRPSVVTSSTRSTPRDRAHGAVAQLVARLVRNEKVRGSNPLSSTM